MQPSAKTVDFEKLFLIHLNSVFKAENVFPFDLCHSAKIPNLEADQRGKIL